MTWSDSKIFPTTIVDILNGTTAIDMNSDAWLTAVYNNTPTPDHDVASAAAAYDAGVWGTANEQDDGTNWDAGGEPLVSPSLTRVGLTVVFDGDDTPQGGANVTLADVYGGLLYNATVAVPVNDQAFCYNYYGGANSVAGGQFTVIHAAGGIAVLDLT